MYDYFDDKVFLKRAQGLCSEIVSEVEKEVRDQGIECQFFLIGSGGRNMVTYLERRDGNIYIDFDYNLNIISYYDWYKTRELKNTVKEAFNSIWRKRYGNKGIQDSTSSLTSPCVYFEDEPNIFFSIDLGIVTLNVDGEWERLIHDKTIDSYHWDTVSPSKGINEKAKILKQNYHWDGKNGVRERYLEIKNRYLSQNDHNHPSFVCYIEAVNEIYQKYGKR